MTTEKDSVQSSSESPLPSLFAPVAVFPQYVATKPRTISIREAEFPNLQHDFVVTTPDCQQLFHVRRDHGNLSYCQHIVDAKTSANVLTIRRNVRKLLLSFRFEDNTEKQILDLQGNLYVPPLGARATASFTNNTDQSTVELTMEGSLYNTHATIKNSATGQLVARMQSEVLNLRAYCGRRDYEVTVSEGMDMAIVTGMIVCLDARSS